MMRSRMLWVHRAFAAAVIVGVGAVAACGTTPAREGDGPVGEALELSCPSGEMTCFSGLIPYCQVNDVHHCGSCTNDCDVDFPHCNALCTAIGSNHFCSFGTCMTGWGDCNSTSSDGCEVNLNTSVANCGTCGHTCMQANVASASCSSGSCVIGTCNAGFTDCDGNPSNGCEVNTGGDPNHCGSCTATPCTAPAHATATCNGGTCGFTCNPGFGDLDGNPSNGCETAFNTDKDCGSLGHNCSQSTVCGVSGATFSCQSKPCSSTADCCDVNHVCGTGSGQQCNTSTGLCVDIIWDPCYCGQLESEGICSDHGDGKICCTNGAAATGAPISLGCDEGYKSIGACCDTCVTDSNGFEVCHL